MKNVVANLTNQLKDLKEINQELATLPIGYLVQKANSYYHVTNEQHKAITKNIPLIKQLCRKRYLLLRCSQLELNMSARHPSHLDTRRPQELIATMPKAYQTVPISYFYHPKVNDWLEKPYKTNTLFPENAIYPYNGINFRSMAERTIAQQLDHYQLLYQYEPTFNIGSKQISPDFFIKNAFSNKDIIWEHYGAFNHEKYADAMNDKMDTYIKLGFTPSKNLIATYQYHIRNTDRLRELIEQIIL